MLVDMVPSKTCIVELNSSPRSLKTKPPFSESYISIGDTFPLDTAHRPYFISLVRVSS